MTRPDRLLQLTRTGYGLALLVDPPRGHPGFGRPLRLLLGARNLAQAAVCAAVPTPAVRGVGVGVDLLHAASMLTVAARAHRYRHPALAQAGAALAFAAAGAALGRRPAPVAP
ncbi:hypothetical protein [Streptacidiphilus sp. P02-A3a]|uniref:hypothetical protein n=1 Tax=Streptacidiphilus sp. P02-A3a TaxID=2704468 RepID=UPI0015FA6E4E|nr:hypothetical protein [Streptacidiphilus sp. P02-A3a]QMU69324.1 hypothetical protein GXP74_14805 [Streptacidiphilus sp. P02-A3a]